MNITARFPARNCPVNTYLSSGFALLQNAIDRSITQVSPLLIYSYHLHYLVS